MTAPKCVASEPITMCATCKEWRHSLYCGRDECPTPDPAIAAERERSAAAARLRANRPPVHCRVLSIGAECTCYLCDIDRLVGAAPQAPAPPLLPHQDVARELRKLVMKRQTEMPWSSGHNGEPYIDGPALAAWEKETDRQIEAALARRAPADQGAAGDAGADRNGDALGVELRSVLSAG